MSYEVSITEVQPIQLAAIKTVAWAQNIADQIREHSQILTSKLNELSIKDTGRYVVVYYAGTEARWDVAPGIPIDVAIEVSTPLAAESAPVVRSSTPGGRVATTVHAGPYQQMHQAHMAIHAWCQQHGHAMTGRNWELYGELYDDPSRLRTQVCYELK
jgi:effector-binding domain-containing protein